MVLSSISISCISRRVRNWKFWIYQAFSNWTIRTQMRIHYVEERFRIMARCKFLGYVLILGWWRRRKRLLGTMLWGHVHLSFLRWRWRVVLYFSTPIGFSSINSHFHNKDRYKDRYIYTRKSWFGIPHYRKSNIYKSIKYMGKRWRHILINEWKLV